MDDDDEAIWIRTAHFSNWLLEFSTPTPAKWNEIAEETAQHHPILIWMRNIQAWQRKPCKSKSTWHFQEPAHWKYDVSAIIYNRDIFRSRTPQNRHHNAISSPPALENVTAPRIEEIYYWWATVHPANSLVSTRHQRLVTFSRANNDSGSPIGEWPDHERAEWKSTM